MLASTEVPEPTTHDWSSAVDHAHLAHIRGHADRYSPGGPLHLLLEILAYVDDEAGELGRPANCRVGLHVDGSISVTDDGRGTDTRTTPAGRVLRKPVMATKDLRFFDQSPPEVLPDGYPRRGASVVAALSDWLVHTNHRPDGAWEQRYQRGVPTEPLRAAPSTLDGPGTTVHYLASRDLLVGDPLTVELVGRTARFPWLVLTVQG